MKTTLIRSTLCATAFAVAATGCADMSQTQRGTATGAGVGGGTTLGLDRKSVV